MRESSRYTRPTAKATPAYEGKTKNLRVGGKNREQNPRSTFPTQQYKESSWNRTISAT